MLVLADGATLSLPQGLVLPRLPSGLKIVFEMLRFYGGGERPENVFITGGRFW